MEKQLNLHEEHTDTLITDFFDPGFQKAFRQYFAELEIQVKDWDGLFREMNTGQDEEMNAAYVRTGPDGSVIGFIQFVPIRFTSWFFEKTCGFIREFWVAEAYRNRGHGSQLLALAEQHFLRQDIHTCILTTDTAQRFYERHGYRVSPGCSAKNRDEAFTKQIG